jgi:hypothetical protein
LVFIQLKRGLLSSADFQTCLLQLPQLLKIMDKNDLMRPRFDFFVNTAQRVLLDGSSPTGFLNNIVDLVVVFCGTRRRRLFFFTGSCYVINLTHTYTTAFVVGLVKSFSTVLVLSSLVFFYDCGISYVFGLGF